MNAHQSLEALKISKARLEREYNKKYLSIEIAARQGARVVTEKWERDLVDYCLSSLKRGMFILLLVRGAYDDVAISYKELLKSLSISEPALDTIIRDCISYGWVLETKSAKQRKGYTDSTFRCTEAPIKQHDNYYAWLRRSHTNVELKRVASAIIEVDYLIAKIEESF